MESLHAFAVHEKRRRITCHENPSYQRSLQRRYQDLHAYHGHRARSLHRRKQDLHAHHGAYVNEPIDGAGPSTSSSGWHYDIEEVEKKHVSTFGMTARRFDMRFRNLDKVEDIEATIENVFDDVIDNIFEDTGAANDVVGIEVSVCNMVFPTYVCISR